MLDILFIVFVSMKIAAMQKAKGRAAAGYVVLFVFLCIAGEIVGAVAGVVIALLTDAQALANDDSPAILYIAGLALVGLVIAGAIGLLIPWLTPPVEDPRLSRLERFDDDYDDDDYRDRRPRSRRDADDGAYPPRIRREHDEGGEFEEPRRR